MKSTSSDDARHFGCVRPPPAVQGVGRQVYTRCPQSKTKQSRWLSDAASAGTSLMTMPDFLVLLRCKSLTFGAPAPLQRMRPMLATSALASLARSRRIEAIPCALLPQATQLRDRRLGLRSLVGGEGLLGLPSRFHKRRAPTVAFKTYRGFGEKGRLHRARPRSMQLRPGKGVPTISGTAWGHAFEGMRKAPPPRHIPQVS